MCLRRIQVCIRSFPCHFIHPLNRLLLGACSGWFVLGAKDAESVKTGLWPKKAQSSRKDIVSKINYDTTEYTQRQALKKYGEGSKLLYWES